MHFLSLDPIQFFRKAHVPVGLVVTEIDDSDGQGLLVGPGAVRDEILERPVPILRGGGPALSPMAIAQGIITQGLDQGSIEFCNSLVLYVVLELRTTVHMHRDPSEPSLLLPVVDEMQARDGEGYDSSSKVLILALPRGCSSFLVVILEETDKLHLVAPVGHQVTLHLANIIFFEAIVECLIVSIVEAHLLELELAVPVAFRIKEEVWIDSFGALDSIRPELALCLRLATRSKTLTPRLLKNVLAHEHRHVTANAIGKPGNLLQDLAHLLASRRVAVIDLNRIFPAVVVHVLAVGKDLVSNLEEILWLSVAAVLRALDE
mmetsp:Transcript_70080/g.146128  ORF Transcript_70080/g.146128 Transcript_70080/m.146128 type:complete len:319 (+) Transcript_70080:331-1287(+)